MRSQFKQIAPLHTHETLLQESMMKHASTDKRGLCTTNYQRQ